MKKFLFSTVLFACILSLPAAAPARTRVSGFMPHSGKIEICGVSIEKAVADYAEITFKNGPDPSIDIDVVVIATAGVSCDTKEFDPDKSVTLVHKATLLLVVLKNPEDLYRYRIATLGFKNDGALYRIPGIRWKTLPLGIDDPRLMGDWCVFVKKELPAEWPKWKQEGCPEN